MAELNLWYGFRTTEIVHNSSYEMLFAEETKPGWKALKGPGQRARRRQRYDRHLHPAAIPKTSIVDDNS